VDTHYYVFGSVHVSAGQYLAMCCLDGALPTVQILWLTCVTHRMSPVYITLHT